MANLRLFERVGIDVALSARGAAVGSVLHQIEGGKASLLAVLEEGQAQILELDVPPPFRPTLLRELHAPPASIIAAILRAGQAIVPRGQDRIEPGDKLLVFTASTSAERVRDYFRSTS
jgi:trk system potassium uptake protein TrkA